MRESQCVYLTRGETSFCYDGAGANVSSACSGVYHGLNVKIVDFPKEKQGFSCFEQPLSCRQMEIRSSENEKCSLRNEMDHFRIGSFSDIKHARILTSTYRSHTVKCSYPAGSYIYGAVLFVHAL